MARTYIEAPTGAVNGVNQTFTVSRPYQPGSAHHFVDGLLHNKADDDGLTETSPTTGVVTLKEPPQPALGNVEENTLLVLYTSTEAEEGVVVVEELQAALQAAPRIFGQLRRTLVLATIAESAALAASLRRGAISARVRPAPRILAEVS